MNVLKNLLVSFLDPLSSLEQLYLPQLNLRHIGEFLGIPIILIIWLNGILIYEPVCFVDVFNDNTKDCEGDYHYYSDAHGFKHVEAICRCGCDIFGIFWALRFLNVDWTIRVVIVFIRICLWDLFLLNNDF